MSCSPRDRPGSSQRWKHRRGLSASTERSKCTEGCRTPRPSRESVVHRAPPVDAIPSDVPSHHRRSFIASTSSLPAGHRVSMATSRPWWQVDFQKRARSRRTVRCPFGHRRNAGKTAGSPVGCRPCPTDRILGGGRRNPSPSHGVVLTASSEHLLAVPVVTPRRPGHRPGRRTPRLAVGAASCGWPHPHGGFAEWSPAVTGPTRTGKPVLGVSSVDVHREPRIFAMRGGPEASHGGVSAHRRAESLGIGGFVKHFCGCMRCRGARCRSAGGDTGGVRSAISTCSDDRRRRFDTCGR